MHKNLYLMMEEISFEVTYEGCSKSIGPLVGKNTIIYLEV